MIRGWRGFGARVNPGWPRWLVFVALLAVAGAAWIRAERLRAVSLLKSSLALQVGSSEGRLWPTRLNNVTFDVSPNLSVGVARVELGLLPWPRVNRAYGVVLRSRAPLDTLWEDARRFTVPAGIEVMDARIEYTDMSGKKLSADGVSFERGTQRDHLRVQALHAFGTTFRDLHFWAGRPRTALEIQIAHEPDDGKAPKLDVSRSPGEGVEWALDIPSQPLPRWASRIGLNVDETWADAVFVGVGSLIVPDSPAHRARGDFRFTIDNWHRPLWPDAALLTGRSGAVALRLSPGPEGAHAITRAEVSAGLFSLVGNGQLSFGEPTRLTFHAQGELDCSRLLAHLPASDYHDRVRSYLRQHRPGSTSEGSVRLELTVGAEAPHGLPLSFRWHLRAGCGLPEMTEE